MRERAEPDPKPFASELVAFVHACARASPSDPAAASALGMGRPRDGQNAKRNMKGRLWRVDLTNLKESAHATFFAAVQTRLNSSRPSLCAAESACHKDGAFPDPTHPVPCAPGSSLTRSATQSHKMSM